MGGAQDRARLLERLGLSRAPARLDEALTHPSASSPARPDYQRLEFLGDRVLGLLVSEALVARKPEEREGQLAPRFNALVREETCADVAREIELGPCLRLGRGEARSGGRNRDAILADAMEALVAAVYLDYGIEGARALVMRRWGPRIATQGAEAPRDAKTALQEWAQARGMPPPDYVETAREGPDHAPHFTVEARLVSGAVAEGSASSKRAAEQRAAAALLETLDD